MLGSRLDDDKNKAFCPTGNLSAYPEAGMFNFIFGCGKIWWACRTNEMQYT
jgi:hypothetical protein